MALRLCGRVYFSLGGGNRAGEKEKLFSCTTDKVLSTDALNPPTKNSEVDILNFCIINHLFLDYLTDKFPIGITKCRG